MAREPTFTTIRQQGETTARYGTGYADCSSGNYDEDPTTNAQLMTIAILALTRCIHTTNDSHMPPKESCHSTAGPPLVGGPIIGHIAVALKQENVPASYFVIQWHAEITRPSPCATTLRVKHQVGDKRIIYRLISQMLG